MATNDNASGSAAPTNGPAMGSAATTAAPAATAPASRVSIAVNGVPRQADARHSLTLLSLLRDTLGLTGAKRGCDRGECGACTVLLDGKPIYACQTLAVQVNGRAVTTIEALGGADEPHPLRDAFLDGDGGQCGYCSPGFVLSAKALLDATPSPTDAQIRAALAGNLCRCNAYGRIIESVKRAAAQPTESV